MSLGVADVILKLGWIGKHPCRLECSMSRAPWKWKPVESFHTLWNTCKAFSEHFLSMHFDCIHSFHSHIQYIDTFYIALRPPSLNIPYCSVLSAELWIVLWRCKNTLKCHVRLWKIQIMGERLMKNTSEQCIVKNVHHAFTLTLSHMWLPLGKITF